DVCSSDLPSPSLRLHATDSIPSSLRKTRLSVNTPSKSNTTAAMLAGSRSIGRRVGRGEHPLHKFVQGIGLREWRVTFWRARPAMSAASLHHSPPLGKRRLTLPVKRRGEEGGLWWLRHLFGPGGPRERDNRAISPARFRQPGAILHFAVTP